MFQSHEEYNKSLSGLETFRSENPTGKVHICFWDGGSRFTSNNKAEFTVNTDIAIGLVRANIGFFEDWDWWKK